MTLGEQSRRDADTVDAVAPSSGPAYTVGSRSLFPPVTEPSPHDRVDTDEIPIVGAPAVDAAHLYGEDDDADPVIVDVERVEPAPEPHVIVERSRPAGLIVTVAFMAVLLLAASTLIAYLWRVSEAWEVRVTELTDAGYELGEQVAENRDALATTEDQLNLVTDQLNASKDTVSRLQAENAQWGDDAAFAQEEIAALEDVIANATTVASSLSRCIEGHEQLADYLRTPDEYEPDELTSFEESVDALCEAAASAHLAFQQSVAP